MELEIDVVVNAPLNVVWKSWIQPEDIVNWNFASDDWCCPKAEINFEEGGIFNYRMEAKDRSMGFDFEGKFVAIKPNELIGYKIADGRSVKVQFIEIRDGVKVVETFEPEAQNPEELQKQGWFCILNNFKKYVETKSI